MTTLLDRYSDMLAELLDEERPLQEALDAVEARAAGENITIDEVIHYFTEDYEVSPEEYATNVGDDSKWALNNDLVGVHYEGDAIEEQLLDEDFDGY